MPKTDVVVQFHGEKGVDHKFIERCPRLKYEDRDYVPLSARLADERFNARALAQLGRA